MGDKTRREEQFCSFCGEKGCYAVGLCRKCYQRKRRNGTLEYKDRSAPRPYMWSEKTKKVLALYKSGVRQAAIAKEVGLTRQGVSIAIKAHARQSNYQRIVAKNPKELAEWLAEVLFHCSNTICDERCPMYKCCCDQSGDNIEDWLMQEEADE